MDVITDQGAVMTISLPRLGSALAAASLTFTLAACGSDAPDRTNAPKNVAGVDGKPSPAPPVGAEVAVEPATFTGPAIAKFGQEEVQSAYRLTSAAAGDHAFRNDMVRPGTYTSSDFDYAREHLSPSARAGFDSKLTKALAGDAATASEVKAYTFFDATAPGATFRSDGDPVVNRKVGSARASVIEDGRLAITVTSSADFRMVRDGNNVLVPIEKDMTFWMVKDGPSWKIDGYTATYQNLTVRPDSD